MMSPDCKATLFRVKLRHQGALEVALRGHCMEPFLREGDKALVKAIGAPELGDICLAFSLSGAVGLHRIVRIASETMLLKGDYEGKYEEIPKSSVLAKACAFCFEEANAWADYEPSVEERLKMVHLSLGIVPEFNECEGDRCQKREAIWGLNKVLREEMLAKLAKGLQLKGQESCPS